MSNREKLIEALEVLDAISASDKENFVVRHEAAYIRGKLAGLLREIDDRA